MVLKKNTAESKGMTYGILALDAVRKFSNEAWLFLAKLLDFLHLCMGEDIHKINTNLILLTGPVFNKSLNKSVLKKKKFFNKKLGTVWFVKVITHFWF